MGRLLDGTERGRRVGRVHLGFEPVASDVLVDPTQQRMHPLVGPSGRVREVTREQRVRAVEAEEPAREPNATALERRRVDVPRHGTADELQRRIDAGELSPDFGPGRLDPAAGGVIVGSRRPLIAFNVNLAGASVEAAREIARVVRERDGGFPGVRALGLDLPSAGQAQVSMNVEDWEASTLHEIVAAIERQAELRGVEVTGAELVGLMPAGAAAAAAGAMLRIDGFDASRLLELRLLG